MTKPQYRYQYLKPDYPKGTRLSWSDELQGVTHDSDYWFFTQKNRLWRFPVDCDLEKVSNSEEMRNAGIPKELTKLGYDHFGDLDHFGGFLFVPVTGGEGHSRGTPVIAVFRASDLHYVGCSQLSKDDASGQTTARWCAIHPRSGELYTSNNIISSQDPMFVYLVDHEAIAREMRVPTFTYSRRFKIQSSTGGDLTIKDLKGGAISDEGMIYTMNGYYKKFKPKDGGIRVFDLETGKLIAGSSNDDGEFRYEFHPGFNLVKGSFQEPEGLTLWNLNDGRAKNIKGGLHAIMLSNKSRDAVYFKHYDLTPVKS